MGIREFILAAVAMGTALAVAPSLSAQDQNQNQQTTQDQSQSAAPIPAYRSPLASLADNGESEANPQELGPDTRPLAGAQDLSVGVPPLTHSYWEPSFNVTSTADSDPPIGSINGGWTTWTTMMAGLDVHRITGHSDMTVNYLGGGVISNDGEGSNSVLQQLGFNDKVSWKRTTLTFIDQLSYIPDITQGYGTLSGLTLPGGGSVGIQEGFLPGQSILTPLGNRLTNSFIAQDDTYLTPRSSLTFVGGYSLLHYYGDNLLDMGDAIFQGGYNYQMTRKNTFALLYRYSGYRYSNFGQSINDNMVQASFGRRVTGKLAFQIAAGPEIAFFETPINASGSSTGGSGGTGTGGTGSSPAGSTSEILWSLNTSLTYQLERTGVGLSYSHGLNGGSGVLAGAEGDSVSGTLSRQLTRMLGASANLGYFRSSGLNIATSTPTSQSYNYWFGGASFNRPVGRTLTLSLSYQMQYQNSNEPFCVGTTCGTSAVRHMITVGLGWHGRPIAY
jgi:hypothetical protein